MHMHHRAACGHVSKVDGQSYRLVRVGSEVSNEVVARCIGMPALPP